MGELILSDLPGCCFGVRYQPEPRAEPPLNTEWGWKNGPPVGGPSPHS